MYTLWLYLWSGWWYWSRNSFWGSSWRLGVPCLRCWQRRFRKRKWTIIPISQINWTQRPINLRFLPDLYIVRCGFSRIPSDHKKSVLIRTTSNLIYPILRSDFPRIDTRRFFLICGWVFISAYARYHYLLRFFANFHSKINLGNVPIYSSEDQKN